MARYRILSWSDIPVGVKAVDAEGTTREELPARFKHAVDAVATATGRSGTQDYLSGWVWAEEAEREGAAPDVATAIAAELDAAHPPHRMREIKTALIERLGPVASNGNHDPTRPDPTSPTQTEDSHHA